MTDNVLTISGIHKSFGGLQVINDVSMNVRRGSRTALIGPNGAGKTTVFNLLTGVYPIDEGTIVLDGTDVSHVPSQDRVIHGMSRSFQNIRLMPHLSTIENVMLGQHSRARSIGSLMFPLGLLCEEPVAAGGGTSSSRFRHRHLSRRSCREPALRRSEAH